MSDEFSSAANGWTPGNGMFTVGSKDPDWDEITPYTDFDGAQARVSNGVLYVTWTPPSIGKHCKIIMPLSRISAITLEEGGKRVCVGNDGDSGWAIPCQRPEEFAEFIGKHLEQYYENEWRQYFPGHARGIAVHG